MAESTDAEHIENTRNLARFFTENRQISWVLLFAVIFWGVFSYTNIAKRKDPEITVRIAVASCAWPGVPTERVEQLVTRPIEQAIASSPAVRRPSPGNEYGIKSTTLPGLAVVHVQLDDDVTDVDREFNKIALELEKLNPTLPQGAGPVKFNSDFGETATILLTVANPRESGVALQLRAREVERAIRELRADSNEGRATLTLALPHTVNPDVTLRYTRLTAEALVRAGLASDPRTLAEPGLVALDVRTDANDDVLLAFARDFGRTQLGIPSFHPDAWPLTVIRDPATTRERIAAIAGDKYSYAQLDHFTDLLARNLQNVSYVSKVTRSAVLPEAVYLEYSQERLASYGLNPTHLPDLLSARNIPFGGGALSVGDLNVQIDATGSFESPDEIAGVVVTETPAGAPVYLRDLVEIVPGYQSPPRYLNYYGRRGENGDWIRTRAISLSIIMRGGEQVAKFGDAIDAQIAAVRLDLPDDLVLARTSDQPRQTDENIDLFMEALIEAVVLVVLVALLGFREWRSALLLAISIPLTLAMTFGMIYVLGVELQQVSVAALIIALGLLVDDPVVAADAIKRELAKGRPALVAAWLGPTKLARAILFATVTNVVAYLPFLLLPGNSGIFVRSLPIVMTCALVASRLVSMTFVPLLGFYLLRTPTDAEPSIQEQRHRGFTGKYYRLGVYALEHRKAWAAGAFVFLLLGGLIARGVPSSFFPADVQYISYVDLWLPTDTSMGETHAVAEQAEAIVERVVADFALKEAAGEKPRAVLVSVTSFVGGAAPRFWFSVAPTFQQPNYAQLIVQVADKDDTPQLVGPLQAAFDAELPGAVAVMNQIQTNPVGDPIEVQLTGRATVTPTGEQREIEALRDAVTRVEAILRSVPAMGVIRNDWFAPAFALRLDVDSDRANLSGVSNLSVAASSAAGINGDQVATYLEGDKQIPVVARLRSEERARVSDLRNLYVYGAADDAKVPLLEVASLAYGLETQRIVRREHFRAVTVSAGPAAGQLASVAFAGARPQLDALAAELPPGLTLSYGGEHAKQQTSQRNLTIVLAISVIAIYLALLLQFNHAIKPLLVFSAAPFGAVGAMAALYLTNTPFGFMAFLGVVALVGVIVSHVIVLFDFIEVNHAAGEPLRDSLLDAGIARMRPIMITVAATVLALLPLAVHGGPLWQPLCYAQIGGLSLATVIELLLVKVFYVIAVKDLKVVGWDDPDGA